ncbi:uncharacterized protein LOC115017986 isoform X2 [Cottoperca gobio]|uniref:Uncharacterized protein LOC115017986 isoform X2 n=1 Tax=Cottoperca gobio TaxID=56716 RepID=A0A6J2QXV2_COTGO|nr:uncharacterized protein LOC115017986 isoform X2 [Cottoperca gobio]
MTQTRSKMIPLFALGYILLVWLICGFTNVSGATVGATEAYKNNCCRKTWMEIGYDIRKAVCCENHLYPGAERSRCGGQAFNPEEDTCCKVENGYTKTAVTEGLSEKVSSCCGLKAYNPLNEICCQSTVVAKPAPKAHCCGQEAFDVDKQLCCGPTHNKTILTRYSSDHLCCGNNQFDSKAECCCLIQNALKTQPISSSCCVKESARLGTKAHNTFQELSSQSTVVDKPAPHFQCCGGKVFNNHTQLCCGPTHNKTILTRYSSDHLCCGNNQFDSKAECCCLIQNALKTQPISSSCCVKKSAHLGTKAHNTFQELSSQSTVVDKPAPHFQCCGGKVFNNHTQLCCGPTHNKTILTRYSCDHLCCGNNQFDSKTECCCLIQNALKTQPISSSCCVKESGRCDEAPPVYNPHTHICCVGCVSERKSEWKPWIDQFYVSHGQHYCGTELYWPHTQICCNGHRHHKKENTHCCGVKAYNIKDPRMKCCAWALHTLTIGHEGQCCGSILQTSMNVCCSSEDEEVLYSAKTGYRCCGHRYYNPSLWSCCAGKLSPVQQPRQNESERVKVRIGTLESVSPHSIMFGNVLKIHGRNGIVTHMASPQILKTPDRCSFPKLIPGNNYLFDEVNVFADFQHNSILQSLHFIISKCHRP